MISGKHDAIDADFADNVFKDIRAEVAGGSDSNVGGKIFANRPFHLDCAARLVHVFQPMIDTPEINENLLSHVADNNLQLCLSNAPLTIMPSK